MDPHLRLHLRITILAQAEAASSRGLTLTSYLIGVKSMGLKVSEDDVEKEIQYLIDKEHLVSVEQEISPEVSRVRITAAGRDWLAKEGHA